MIEFVKDYVKSQFLSYKGKFTGAQMFVAAEITAKELLRHYNGEYSAALVLGAYLHDVGRVRSDEKDHVQHSAAMAMEMLKGKISPEELDIVIDMCLNHGRKSLPKTLEGQLIKSLDKLPFILMEYPLSVNKLIELYDTLGDYKEFYYTEYKKRLDKLTTTQSLQSKHL